MIKIRRVPTEDAVECWVSACLSGTAHYVKYKANSAESIGRVFISYNTPVAYYDGGRFVLNARKYSVTTSKLQNYLRRHIKMRFSTGAEEVPVITWDDAWKVIGK